LKSLRQADPALAIQGLDYFPDAFGFRYCDAHAILPDLLSSDVSGTAWLEALAAVTRGFGSELVFIGADFELLPLARARDWFERETGSRLIVGSVELVETCKDKLRTAQRLTEKGLDAPKSLGAEVGFDAAADAVGLPFIIKPRAGARSRGVALIERPAQFDAAMDEGDGLMVQQHLPDASREYTCGVLTFDGVVDVVTPLRRTLRDGNTWTAESPAESDPEGIAVAAYCRRVAEALCADGPINVQCRILDGRPLAFEVNPRFSGTTYFRTLLGVNEPLRVVMRHEERLTTSSPPSLRPGRVRRYFEERLDG